jgi:acetylornithine aminotransferase
MALRIMSKRACAVVLRTPRANYVPARFASAASAALKGSSLPQDVKDSIAVGASLSPFAYFLANH